MNLFANIKTNPAFGNLWGRVGFNFFGKVWETSNRVECDPKGTYMFSAKNVIRKNDLTFGLVTIF